MNLNNGNGEKLPSAEPSSNAGAISQTGFRALGLGLGLGLGRQETDREEVEHVDFKMVTFSLAGKDYGIDIMRVKEIARFGDFTYVPNTRPFVTGVYNLRGDIISIIDFRLMFNLPLEPRPAGELEDGLIIRLQQNVIGVVVDRVDRVVGIASESIQPPHPIFADVNIRYISGVVEHDGRLYIILDVDRIFVSEEDRLRPALQRVTPAGRVLAATEQEQEREPERSEPAVAVDDFSFVVDGLATFRALYVSDINREWVLGRYEQWRQLRAESGKPVQFGDEHDAAEFTAPFASACSGRLWDTEYAERIRTVLPRVDGRVINAWNPGCGKGHETYSLAALLVESAPEKRIRIWAGDNDLLSISTAPNLILAADEVPPYVQPFTSKSKKGLTMRADLRERILFEYHDVLHENGVPESHLILCRDLLSLLKPEAQERLLDRFHETLAPEGVLIVGRYEDLAHDNRWELIDGDIKAYRRL